jgi:hypothetical protein
MMTIPFVPNTPDDTHCVGAVYRMVHQYFFHEDISWEEIDRITRKEKGKGIWTFPLDIVFAKKGLRIRNIEDVEYQKLYTQKAQYIQNHFGKQNAEYYVYQSNILSLIDLIPEYLHVVMQETRKATIADIRTYLTEGCLIGAELDSGRLNGGKSGCLHYVLLYGITDDTIMLHDPGLPPQKARVVPIEKFTDACFYEGAGCALTIFSDQSTLLHR